MSDIAAQPWKRLRLCARLCAAASIATFALFVFSLIASLVLFSPLNSWVVAISGGGLTLSGNSSADSGIASLTVHGAIQLHLQDSAHRFAECTIHSVWHEYGFRQFNIPIYLLTIAFAILAVLAHHAANLAARKAGVCRHCGYPRPAPTTLCPECGKTAAT